MLRFLRLRARTPGIDELIPPEEALPSYTARATSRRPAHGSCRPRWTRASSPIIGCWTWAAALAASPSRSRSTSTTVAATSAWTPIARPSGLQRVDRLEAAAGSPSSGPTSSTPTTTAARRPSAAQYRFPFDDDAFDFVFSNSLFTHLVPDDARNYFHEIGRVLKPGGRTVNTIFLLNEESLSLVEGGESRQGVLHQFGDLARVKKPDRPEAWIAFDEDFVRQAHDRGRAWDRRGAPMEPGRGGRRPVPGGPGQEGHHRRPEAERGRRPVGKRSPGPTQQLSPLLGQVPARV